MGTCSNNSSTQTVAAALRVSSRPVLTLHRHGLRRKPTPHAPPHHSRPQANTFDQSSPPYRLCQTPSSLGLAPFKPASSIPLPAPSCPRPAQSVPQPRPRVVHTRVSHGSRPSGGRTAPGRARLPAGPHAPYVRQGGRQYCVKRRAAGPAAARLAAAECRRRTGELHQLCTPTIPYAAWMQRLSSRGFAVCSPLPQTLS